MDKSQLKAIPLTKGHVAYVDPEDYDELSKHKWNAAVRSNGRVYAVRSVWDGSKVSTIRMHRHITKASVGTDVDHADHDTLNNSKANLRVCSRADNVKNSRKNTAATSTHKGVCFRAGKWESRIAVNGRRLLLGRFESEQVAADAYDFAATELHGEFANTNSGIKADPGEEPLPVDQVKLASQVFAVSKAWLDDREKNPDFPKESAA